MKKLTLLIAMLMATSAWGATTHVYLECNKPNPTIKQIPTWLGLTTILKNDGEVIRRVETYKGENVEKGATLGLYRNDRRFWWKGYSLDRETLKLEPTEYYSRSLVKQCIIYPLEEWKNRKRAYLDGLKKRRKL